MSLKGANLHNRLRHQWCLIPICTLFTFFPQQYNDNKQLLTI